MLGEAVLGSTLQTPPYPLSGREPCTEVLRTTVGECSAMVKGCRSGDRSAYGIKMTTQSSSNATRSSLIQRATQRDAKAWRELVDLYGPLVAHWCRQSSVDAHSAADCVQEVFTSVVVALDQFSPQRTSGSFRAWFLDDHPQQVARPLSAEFQIPFCNGWINRDEPDAANSRSVFDTG